MGGIKKMVVGDVEEEKLMTQLQAVISSLESLKLELVKLQMKETLVEDVKKSLGLSD